MEDTIALTQQEDKSLSIAIDRVKIEVAQESATLKHQISSLHDKSDLLSARIKELEEIQKQRYRLHLDAMKCI